MLILHYYKPEKKYIIYNISDKEKNNAFKYISFLKNFIKKQHLRVYNNFDFFIINSFFSNQPYNDIDIILTKKIDKNYIKTLDEVNSFFNDENLFTKNYNFNQSVDFSFWDVSTNSFLNMYKPHKKFIKGQFVINKYFPSQNNLPPDPSIKKIKSNLYIYNTDIYPVKLENLAKQNIFYTSPVNLFSFQHITNTEQLAAACIINEIILEDIPEMKMLIPAYKQRKENLTCSNCAKISLNDKYINYLKELFDSKYKNLFYFV
jgi:hypothetical protein